MEVRRVVLFRRAAVSCWIVTVTLSAGVASAQLPSFNGAEGFGGTFTGTAPTAGWFSNATVYHVNTTADTMVGGKPAQGTLRGAFYDYTNPSSPKQMASNRIVVFDVGGTFDISSASLDIKTVNNIYIAGQTAPTPVTVYGNLTQITASNNTQNSNVILRYMTFRKGTGNGDDAITFKNGGAAAPSTNMIIDHVSASWSEDEVLSVANFNRNVTVQYTMMTDSLTNGHQYGSLIRPEVDSNVTYHHNLYANDKSRNPRMGSYNNTQLTFDFRDNVIYNYSDRAGYAGGGSDGGITEKVNVNWVGNYTIVGQALSPLNDPTIAVTKDIGGTNAIQLEAYQAANLIDTNKNAVRDGTDTGWNMFRVSTGAPLPETDKATTPFAAPPVTTTGAADAYNQVLNFAGNFWWTRNTPADPAHDPIAKRIIDNVKNNTQPAGGVPAAAPEPSELMFVAGPPIPPATTRPSGWDTDGDGMPDAWETAHGLNPSLGTDFKLDYDNDGYVNLQEYIDEVGAFPAPTPLTFTGATSTRYALITNWKTSDFTSADAVVHPGSNWQPTRFDEARINSGTVAVDAAGQHAGVLKIGAVAAQSATLNINSGWLDVASQLVIGADPGATAIVNLSGGVLSAPTISKGAGGTFNFTGGTLHADTVNFNLVNNGGTLAPGHSVGQTHVAGNLTLASGALQIELASTSSADSLLVDGDATLGGNLNVLLLGGFTPTLGNNWPIIAADNILNQFATITGGYSVQKQGDILRLYFGPAPPLNPPGDFNGDGTVDTADYIVLRANFGNPYTEDDFNTWRTNFGASNGGAAGAATGFSGSSVPEPATWVLGAALAAALWGRSRLRYPSDFADFWKHFARKIAWPARRPD